MANAQETRIIIAGSRHITDYQVLKNVMNRIFRDRNTRNLTVISGTAAGADQLGEEFAKRNQLKLCRFPADWETYGRAAGPKRNEEMARFAVSDRSEGILVALWDGKSPGTKNMISTAKKYGLETHVIHVGTNNRKGEGT